MLWKLNLEIAGKKALGCSVMLWAASPRPCPCLRCHRDPVVNADDRKADTRQQSGSRAQLSHQPSCYVTWGVSTSELSFLFLRRALGPRTSW